jgi:putative phosphoesterase
MQTDEVWHAGDIGDLKVCKEIQKLKPLRAVSGNIDGRLTQLEYPETLSFTVENVKVCMLHIGGYPGKYSADAKRIMQKEQPGLFICGHSHILKIQFDKVNNLLFINPGACGNHGFHAMKTAVHLEIEGNEFRNCAVIELGQRASISNSSSQN